MLTSLFVVALSCGLLGRVPAATTPKAPAGFCKCLDITPLFDNLIAELEDLKGVTNELRKMQSSVVDLAKTLHTLEGRTRPRDCQDIRRSGSIANGVYTIYIANEEQQKESPVDVYCDFETPGGNWLVFQRRQDGSVDFERNWNNYTNGFGDPKGEFWLGNEILHQLTSSRRYKLRIDLDDFDGQKRHAEYSSFTVGPLSDYYRLKIGSYTGDSGDSLLSLQNDMQFTTIDSDRDTNKENNCAKLHRGAWWYNACHHSNLNGKYWKGTHTSYADGVNWYTWRGFNYSLKRTEMKISPL